MALKRSTCNQSQDDVYISKRSKAASVETTGKLTKRLVLLLSGWVHEIGWGSFSCMYCLQRFGFTLITAVSEFQQNISV